VIVVDGGGDLTNSLIGEKMSAHAEQRGIAGMVIYGSIRDYDSIHAGKFPIFAAGVTHRGPYKDGPGEINVPIAIDGMVIEPGDLIVGDGDGIVCIPFANTAEVLKATTAKHEAETKQLAAIKAGKSDRSWVDASLKKLGVIG
jgi:regulator of RNase E activity RraA